MPNEFDREMRFSAAIVAHDGDSSSAAVTFALLSDVIITQGPDFADRRRWYRKHRCKVGRVTRYRR